MDTLRIKFYSTILSDFRKQNLIIKKKKKKTLGNSLVVQWLRLHTFTAVGLGSIPGRGTKIPQAVLHGQTNKETLNITNKSKNKQVGLHQT